MIGALTAIACGVLSFTAATAWMGWVSGIFPGLATTVFVYWLISHKVMRAIEPAMRQIQQQIQQQHQ